MKAVESGTVPLGQTQLYVRVCCKICQKEAGIAIRHVLTLSQSLRDAAPPQICGHVLS